MSQEARGRNDRQDEQPLPEEIAALSFERALEELEQVVDDLESGELKLEEQVARYERGMLLIRACRDKLEQASAKIAKVVGVEGEEVVLEEMEEEP